MTESSGGRDGGTEGGVGGRGQICLEGRANKRETDEFSLPLPPSSARRASCFFPDARCRMLMLEI